MNRLVELVLYAAHLALLRGVSWLVPPLLREEWHREWASELSHARRICLPAQAFSWGGAHKLTRYCLGSFQDALCLRRMEPKHRLVPVLDSDSAGRCILYLCAVVFLSAVVAGYLPGIRTQEDAARETPDAGALLIRSDIAEQTISFQDYHEWNSIRQPFFKNLAFFWTEKLPAKAASSRGRKWYVAHTSDDLFDWLTGNAISAEGNIADLPRAVLSRSIWRTDFNSDPAIIGTAAWIGGRHVEIAGIAPDDTWRLPHKPDIWILESDAQLKRHTYGYVIAQLSAKGLKMMTGNAVRISAYTSQGDEIDLFGTVFSVPATGTFTLYVFALILAILALPAVTSVFQNECDIASERPSLKIRATAWGFLLAKFGLIAAIGYFGAVDIAYCGFPEYSPSAQLVQLLFSFSICLAGFRWALLDQNRRCPVCLRIVTHPAQVGIASCNFLGWNGTEMVCMGGHALLHVPNLPTSWFGRQRWTYLDKSWEFLFATVASRL